VTPEFGGTGIAGARHIGDSEPLWNMAFVNDFTIAKNLNLYTMFEWRYGQSVTNLTLLLADLGQTSQDFVAVGREPGDVRDCHPDCFGEERVQEFFVAGFPWTFRSSFFKARDISLTWTLPSAWASAFFSSQQIRLRLSARNLFTITPYEGLDPEVSNFGNTNVGRSIEVAPYPPSRSVWLGFDITL
jgi:hypothetical protein